MKRSISSTKIAVIGIAVTAVGAIAAALVVPEFRGFIGLEDPFETRDQELISLLNEKDMVEQANIKLTTGEIVVDGASIPVTSGYSWNGAGPEVYRNGLLMRSTFTFNAPIDGKLQYFHYAPTSVPLRYPAVDETFEGYDHMHFGIIDRPIQPVKGLPFTHQYVVWLADDAEVILEESVPIKIIIRDDTKVHFIADLELIPTKISKVEQGGANQPAAALKSKPEDNSNPEH